MLTTYYKLFFQHWNKGCTILENQLTVIYFYFSINFAIAIIYVIIVFLRLSSHDSDYLQTVDKTFWCSDML